jgi:uncharacterized protein (TIGR04255 family)
MAEQRLLRKPPIVEALIDIRFNVPETTKLTDLRAICEFFAAELPSFEERNTGSAKIELRGVEGIKIESATPEISHFVRTNSTASSPATRSIVIQRDGITVSHANNYGGWDELITLTRRLFEQFVQIVNPLATIRLGARYINKIELPHTSVDLDKYFICGPKIPPKVPQRIFEFYHRIGIVAEPPSLKAWINQFTVKIGDDISPFVILDIDVFQSERYAPIWNDIAKPSEKIHDLKNLLFFGSLTDFTLDAYT